MLVSTASKVFSTIDDIQRPQIITIDNALVDDMLLDQWKGENATYKKLFLDNATC